MINALCSRILLMLCGLLYPAYASYKAVRYRNMSEYSNWMMYWTIISLFICLEYITDAVLCWFPFYYELKIAFVLWLLPIRANGSASLYTKFIRPLLDRNELELDEYITQIRERGFRILTDFTNSCMRYAIKFLSIIMQGDWFEKNEAVFNTFPAIVAKALLPEPLLKIADDFDAEFRMNELWETELLDERKETFDTPAPRRTQSTSTPYSDQDESSQGRSRSRVRRTGPPTREKPASTSQQHRRTSTN